MTTPDNSEALAPATGSEKFHVQYRNRIFTQRWLAWTRWSIDTDKAEAEAMMGTGRLAAGFEQLRIVHSPND